MKAPPLPAWIQALEKEFGPSIVHDALHEAYRKKVFGFIEKTTADLTHAEFTELIATLRKQKVK